MKKIIVVLMSIFAIAGCKQREEPKPQYQFPTGPVQSGSLQSQDEVKILKDAIQKDPKNVDAWIKLGNIMMDTGKAQEAVDAYQKALALNPNNVDVRVDMGTCYRNVGKSDIAVKEYKKAIQINPNHAYAHKNLGVVLASDFKDTAQAIKEFEKYLELAPNASDAADVRMQVEKMKSAR